MTRDYKTGRLLARVVSGIGWAIGAAGVLVALFSFFTPFMDFSGYMPAAPVTTPGLPAATSGMPAMLIVLSAGLGLIVYGALIVAVGQASRAMMDNADYTRQLLDFIRKN